MGMKKQLHLLVRGDISVGDERELTQLHHAVKKWQLDIVQNLIGQRAPRSMPDRDGLTPLDMTLESGPQVSTRLLQERGAKQGWI